MCPRPPGGLWEPRPAWPSGSLPSGCKGGAQTVKQSDELITKLVTPPVTIGLVFWGLIRYLVPALTPTCHVAVGRPQPLSGLGALVCRTGRGGWISLRGSPPRAPSSLAWPRPLTMLPLSCPSPLPPCGLTPPLPCLPISGFSSAITASGASPLIFLAWALPCSSARSRWAVMACTLPSHPGVVHQGWCPVPASEKAPGNRS